MAGVTRINYPDRPVTAEEVATLCDWPPLAGFVILGFVPEDLEIKMATDTSDLNQVCALLRATLAKLELVAAPQGSNQ